MMTLNLVALEYTIFQFGHLPIPPSLEQISIL